MGRYTYQKRPGQPDAAPRQAARPNLAQAVPNSAALDMLDHVQERPQAQIPAAEAEADRLSASVTSGGPEAVKAAMGRRLGADFSGIRFHMGDQAEAKAEAMNARAYTSGADIYFGEGGFDPSVAAHELVHTAQQGVVAASTPTVATPVGGVQRDPLELKNKSLSRSYRHDHAYQQIRKISKAYNKAVDFSERSDLRKHLQDIGNQYLDTNRTAGKGGTSIHNGRQEQIRKMLSQLSESQRIEAEARKGDRSHLGDIYAQHKAAEAAGTSSPSLFQELVQDSGRAAEAGLSSTPIPVLANGKYKADDIKNLADQIAPTMSDKLDPVLRQNTARAKSSSISSLQDSDLRAAVDDELNHEVIAASMHLVDPANIGDKLTPEEAARANQAGSNMAHTMLAAQLGKITISSNGGDPQNYGHGMKFDPSMASLFAYGGRTAFDFGPSTQEGTGAKDVYRSMVGKDVVDEEKRKLANDVTTRRFATHNLSDSELKEKHGSLAAAKAFVSPLHNQRGFDLAVGGAGNEGYRAADTASPDTQTATGHTIKANGQEGHVYMGLRKSVRHSDTHGGLLVGIETSGSGKTNLTGKAHTAAAVKSPFSATGADKSGIYGDEYGGRRVDLTGITTDEQVKLQHMLTKRMDDLSKAYYGGGEGSENARKAYNDMMDKLSGSKMDPTALTSMLLNSDDQNNEEFNRIKAMIERAQAGGQR